MIPDDANLELSRDATLDLVSYRAEKRFRIFSMANSLLLGAIGGQAFFSDSRLHSMDRYFLSAAIVLLVGWAVVWLRFNRIALSNELRHLRELESQLHVHRASHSSEPRYIYEFSTIVLGALALVMSLWGAVRPSCP